MKKFNFIIATCLFIGSTQRVLYSQQDKFTINIEIGGQISELSEPTGRASFELGRIIMEEQKILPKSTDNVFSTLYMIFKSNGATSGFDLSEKEIILKNADNEIFTPIRSSDFTIKDGVRHSLTIQSLGKEKVKVDKSYFISNKVENGLKLILEIPKKSNIKDLSLYINKTLVGVIETLIK